MDLKKYFSANREAANEQFANANDWDFADGKFGYSDNRFGYADDGDGKADIPVSQPYIISIYNSTTVDVSTVNLLNAYTNINAANYGLSTYLSVTMGISSVSYVEFLYQSMNKPFNVAMLYVQSTTNAQVAETVTVTMKDATGNQIVKPMVAVIDPYQFQTGTIVHKVPFRVDGYTQLTLAKVYAGLTVKLYLYPDQVIDIGRAASGYGVKKELGNPKVISQG
jgi:hypothetical protein